MIFPCRRGNISKEWRNGGTCCNEVIEFIRVINSGFRIPYKAFSGARFGLMSRSLDISSLLKYSKGMLISCSFSMEVLKE